jgi:hypothetical protein
LSIIHDPLDVPAFPAKGAEDVLIFSYPFYLKLFISSEHLERTDSLRLRLTRMEVMHILYETPSISPPFRFLDLSTSTFSRADLLALLKNMPLLLHLLLDQCGTLDNASIQEWSTFGYSCMMLNDGFLLEDELNQRLGLATSQAQLGASTSYPGVSSPSPQGNGRGVPPRKVTVLPQISALRTLALSIPPDADRDAGVDAHALIAAFQRGWSNAVGIFNERMHTVRQSRSEGALLLRFPLPNEVGDAVPELVDYGLVVVDDDDFARLDMVLDEGSCPVVCLAGSCGKEEGIEHVEGCAHSIGWDTWDDAL